MLGQKLPSCARRRCGRVCVALTCLAASYTAWTAQPGSVTPQTVTKTPHSADVTGLVPSQRTASWCKEWQPARVFGGGGNPAVYAQDVNPDGALSRVLVARSNGYEVEVAVGHSARHEVRNGDTLHLFTLYDGARYEGVAGSSMVKVMQHFDELTVPIQASPQMDFLQYLDAESSKELQSFIDKITRAAPRWNVTVPCP